MVDNTTNASMWNGSLMLSSSMRFLVVFIAALLVACLPGLSMADSNTIDQDFCIGRANGHFSDPLDCGQFYQCAHGRTFHMPCPDGLYFDERHDVCNWPHEVDCKAASKETTTSTTTTTTRPATTTTTKSATTTNAQTTTTGAETTAPNGKEPCSRIVCYFSNDRLSPLGGADKVDSNLCTHIIYSYATITPGGEIKPSKPTDDPTFMDKIGNYGKITKNKIINDNLKVLLSVGGPKVGPGLFMRVVYTPENRKRFIGSVIKFLRDRNFDGLDLAWEFPTENGSFEEDREKYSKLVKEMRQSFEQESTESGKQRLLLTATVSARKRTIDAAYDVSVLNQELDFINLMTFGFHSTFEPSAMHPSALYASSNETSSNLRRNVNWAARYWVKLGASKDKLVIGTAIHGIEFSLKSRENVGIGAPTTGNGKNNNIFYYFNVCLILNSKISKPKVHFIEEQQVPYLVANRNQWVGYENARSLGEKVKYVRQNGFGGVAAFNINMDDMSGIVCKQGVFPLLNAINTECAKQY